MILHPPLVASSACMKIFPHDLVVDCLLDFQYNSCFTLHPFVGGTDLPIMESSVHLSWKRLCICLEHVHVLQQFHGFNL